MCERCIAADLLRYGRNEAEAERLGTSPEAIERMRPLWDLEGEDFEFSDDAMTFAVGKWVEHGSFDEVIETLADAGTIPAELPGMLRDNPALKAEVERQLKAKAGAR